MSVEHDASAELLAEVLTRLLAVEASLVFEDGKPGRPGPYAWAALDAGQGTALLDCLADFVDWLNARYGRDRRTGVAPCWPLHGAVVEEVTALYAAWLDAYHRPTRQSVTPAAWHATLLPGFLARLRGQGGPLSGCDDGHRDSTATAPLTHRIWR